MTNLTQDAALAIKGEASTEKFLMDTSSAQTIYKGCPVMIDQSIDTTHVVTAASVTVVSGDVFMGIAAEGKVVAAADPETTLVELYVGPTIVGFKSTVFTDTDLGKAVHMSDTGTLSASSGAYNKIGKLFRVQDGFAFVLLDTPLVQTGS